VYNKNKRLLHTSLWAALMLTAPMTAATAAEPSSSTQIARIESHPNAGDELRHIKPVNPAKLGLKSSSLVVYDPVSGEVLMERQADKVRPIASLTKLMTAMVVLDANLPMDEVLTITKDDVDRLRHSRSRLPVGTKLTRHDMLQLALAASENRAASALARTYPGGTPAFVRQMNNKSRALGLKHTRFVDSTGLHDENVSTAADLVKLTIAANEYDPISEMSTNGTDYVVDQRRNRKIEFRNTNMLVRNKDWDVNLSKTGYIISAGYCLVMHTVINDRPLAMILLNSQGKYSKFGDANKIKQWLMKVDNRPQVTASLADS
jgi:D-alanyl-D-alanine endopeptidase (penicillin-binding protein 7)